MKKYKLIKEYPGSPELGYRVDDICFVQFFCDSYPEFWEEIKEYDFEIIKFKFKEVGTFSYDSKDIEITSIKRLSDGEIFCIGDRCQPKNYVNPGTIEKFEFVLGDQLRIQGKNEKGKRSWYLSIDTIEKLETPLFTTLDGKDIYEGDSYYTVFFKETKDKSDPERWKVLGKFCAEKLIGTDKMTNECKYFSSIASAVNWLEENKPQFSKKQVINILKGLDRELNEYEDTDIDYYSYIEKYKDEK